jgi:O-methyltransferase involved in polyketide biosynthesis
VTAEAGRFWREGGHLVTDQEPVVPGIDVTRPSVARVYDFWLGGKDNFAVDREMGGRMAELNPSLPRLVRDNRRFLCAAAARAARAGVGQFLDLGAGLPAHPAVHEAVREVNPGARVCYVDNDPAAALHAAVLLADGDGLAAVQGDLTEPDALLAHPDVRAVLNFGKPVGIVLGAVLHFLPADAAARLCAAYLGRATRGSWLIVSTGHYADKQLRDRLQEAATHARFWNHDRAAVTSWLAGMEIVPPGVCEAGRWIAGIGGVPAGRPVYSLAAAAVKTGD